MNRGAAEFVCTTIRNYSVSLREFVMRVVNPTINGHSRRGARRSETCVITGLMATQCHPSVKALEALGQSGPEDGMARVKRSKVIVPPT